MTGCTVKKEWAAITDDEEDIIETANTRAGVRRRLHQRGEDPNDYHILAVPQTNSGWMVL